MTSKHKERVSRRLGIGLRAILRGQEQKKLCFRLFDVVFSRIGRVWCLVQDDSFHSHISYITDGVSD